AHRRQHEAGARRLPVHRHRAGAARAMLAAEVRRREPTALAQEIGERLARLDRVGDLGAVEPQRNGDHESCISRMARNTVAVCSGPWYASASGSSLSRSAAIARRSASSSVAAFPRRSVTCVNRRGHPAAAASTTEAGPPFPSDTANAIELANAPLLRATFAKPQRSEAVGSGRSKPRMTSPAVSDVV